MKRNSIIKVKAVFLLVAFSFNSLSGFACSLQMAKPDHVSHHWSGNNEDISEAVMVPVIDYVLKSSEDNCCTDQVLQLAELDKILPKSAEKLGKTFKNHSSLILHENECQVADSRNYHTLDLFLRNYHPPIHDIRIAVQSFQI